MPLNAVLHLLTNWVQKKLLSVLKCKKQQQTAATTTEKCSLLARNITYLWLHIYICMYLYKMYICINVYMHHYERTFATWRQRLQVVLRNTGKNKWFTRLCNLLCCMPQYKCLLDPFTCHYHFAYFRMEVLKVSFELVKVSSKKCQLVRPFMIKCVQKNCINHLLWFGFIHFRKSQNLHTNAVPKITSAHTPAISVLNRFSCLAATIIYKLHTYLCLYISAYIIVELRFTFADISPLHCCKFCWRFPQLGMS